MNTSGNFYDVSDEGAIGNVAFKTSADRLVNKDIDKFLEERR